MSYYYKKSEPGLWTVGCEDGGKWEPESDHNTPDKAAARVAFLNGGPAEPKPAKRPDDGGLAFPGDVSKGMTLRDYMAAAVLPTVLQISDTQDEGRTPFDGLVAGMCKTAYQVADAMLAARQK